MEPKQWHMVYGSYCNCANGRHGPRHQLTLAFLTELEQERDRLRLALEERRRVECEHCAEGMPFQEFHLPYLVHECRDNTCYGHECEASDWIIAALSHEPVKEEAESFPGGKDG